MLRSGRDRRDSNPAGRRRALRVTVLCGGPSAEREVSLDSGRAVADALRSRGHDVFVADVGPDKLEALDQPTDVVFPALHGTFGEDGTVQRLLEERRLPYVGSDSRASAIAMDKVATKRLVREAGIDTPEFEVWDRTTSSSRTTPTVPLPVVVKPVDQGSSVDTTIVRESAAFLPAVEQTIAHFGQALIEAFVAGEELTVGFLGTEPLPPICIRPQRGFYDYEAKYSDQTTEYHFETRHPPELLQTAQALSKTVFTSVGCRHLARVDWIIDAAERLWFLELNTIPGFTSHSLVPKAAARIGIPFEELVDRLIRMALEEGP